ncbi:MAG TPA: hypothetical protein VG895_00435 [Patescibacteria group bacterium]|nr:hypothetical protein [Gammaproteobacteria bacterium]HWA51509.1 hypothetical protein [Patescibacteria group bacterium]
MEKLSNESTLGFVGIFAWCIISAVAFVFTALLEMKIDATLLCFGIFLIAAIFFLLSRLNNLASLKKKCKSQFLNLLIINITTFGCWFLSIFPLQYMEPSVAQSILAAAVPIATLIIGIMLYRVASSFYLTLGGSNVDSEIT